MNSFPFPHPSEVFKFHGFKEEGTGFAPAGAKLMDLGLEPLPPTSFPFLSFLWWHFQHTEDVCGL